MIRCKGDKQSQKTNPTKPQSGMAFPSKAQLRFFTLVHSDIDLEITGAADHPLMRPGVALERVEPLARR